MYVSIINEQKFDYIYIAFQFFYMFVNRELCELKEIKIGFSFVKLRLTLIFLILTKQKKNCTLKNRTKDFTFKI